jgi:predicted TIM-barrel fold metal-dependent hydrolase
MRASNGFYRIFFVFANRKDADVVVDYQTHWYPRRYLESSLGRPDGVIPRAEFDGRGFHFHGPHGDHRYLEPRFFDLDIHMADMDRYGLTTMVCSPNLVGDVTYMEVAEATDTCLMLNEELAAAQSTYAGRFVGLSMLPLQDVDAALRVLEHASEVGLPGVCMLPHVEGANVANLDNLPVYRRMGELGMPLFLHPAHRSAVFRAGMGRPIEVGLNWMHDTASVAVALVVEGILDECPDLVVMHPHGGGTLPYVAGRIDHVSTPRDFLTESIGGLRQKFSAYLPERFYTDTAIHTPAALPVATETYGPERVLYASDYPWMPRDLTLDLLRGALEPAEVTTLMARTMPELRMP